MKFCAISPRIKRTCTKLKYFNVHFQWQAPLYIRGRPLGRTEAKLTNHKLGYKHVTYIHQQSGKLFSESWFCWSGSHVCFYIIPRWLITPFFQCYMFVFYFSEIISWSNSSSHNQMLSRSCTTIGKKKKKKKKKN